MNNKLLLVFILLFLVFLLIFYYLKLKTNLILLLSVIIVLCINNLILQTEYFNDSFKTYNNNNIARSLIQYIQDYIFKQTKSKTPTYVPTFNSSDLKGSINNIPVCSTSCSLRNMLNNIKPKPTYQNYYRTSNTTYPTFKYDDISKEPVTIITSAS